MSNREPKSNFEWKKWGKIDPLWSVATWVGKQKGGVSPWTDDEFYRLGESDWHDFCKQWSSYGVDDGSCVEIGCGAGRLTMHMATYFERIYALDVAEEMLRYASERLSATNVTFQLVDGKRIPQADESVTAVFSAHVFQHFDTLEQAALYFSEACRVLKPKGTLMIHAPVSTSRPPGRPVSYLLFTISRWGYEIKFGAKRLLARYDWVRPPMRSLEFPIGYLFDTLAEIGFVDIEIRAFRTESNNAIHPFVFARKPAHSASPNQP